jgi:hypothetical protein
MKEEHRLAIYVLVTALIEAPCILILYSLGSSNGSLNGLGYMAETIGLNIVFFYFALSAIGGYESHVNEQPLSPLVVWGAGVFTMFLMITIGGETINWLIETAMEATGPQKEVLKFNRRLKSAVHDFVQATYSSARAQKQFQTRIKQLYSEHPELVDKYMSETLDRIEKAGSAKTAARVKTLMKELHETTKKEQSSEKEDEPNH